MKIKNLLFAVLGLLAVQSYAHKFNGFINYFYVGSHINSVGLLDIYAKIETKLGEKSNLTAFAHNFSAQSEITESIDKKLGTKIDFVYSHKLKKDVTIGADYSQMFSSEGLKVIKNNSEENRNNWALLMITVEPTLFSSKIVILNSRL